MSEWVQTEISNGRFSVTDGEYTIRVYADFSGAVEDVNGNTLEFADLRVFIDAADVLRLALTDHYGGYQ